MHLWCLLGITFSCAIGLLLEGFCIQISFLEDIEKPYTVLPEIQLRSDAYKTSTVHSILSLVSTIWYFYCQNTNKTYVHQDNCIQFLTPVVILSSPKMSNT